MKKLVFFFPAIVLLSCSPTDENKTNTDSVKKEPTVVISGVQQIKTDSGTLSVNVRNGEKAGEASLTDDKGKVVCKGIYVNDEKNGAWITYDANGKPVHAEHYGNGVVQKILDPEDFDFDTIVQKDLGISFVVPKNWVSVKSDEPKTLVIYQKALKDPAIKTLPTLKVIKVPLQMGDDIHSLASTQDNSLAVTTAHYTPVAADSMFINSYPAFMQYGMYDFTDHGYGFLKAIVVCGDSAYYFDCAAENYDGDFLLYQGVFEMIVRSFRPLSL